MVCFCWSLGLDWEKMNARQWKTAVFWISSTVIHTSTSGGSKAPRPVQMCLKPAKKSVLPTMAEAEQQSGKPRPTAVARFARAGSSALLLGRWAGQQRSTAPSTCSTAGLSAEAWRRGPRGPTSPTVHLEAPKLPFGRVLLLYTNSKSAL